MRNIERLVLHAEESLSLFKLIFTIYKRVTERQCDLLMAQFHISTILCGLVKKSKIKCSGFKILSVVIKYTIALEKKIILLIVCEFAKPCLYFEVIKCCIYTDWSEGYQSGRF